MVVAGLDVGRVEVDVGHPARCPSGRVRNTATSSSMPLQIRLTVDFDTPDSQPNAVDEVVDLPGRGAGDVRGHDHRPQRLIHPPTRLQQAREERPDTQLRDAQLDVTSRGRQRALPGAVALVGSGVGSFVELRADRRGQLASISCCIPRSRSWRNRSLLSPSPSCATRSSKRASSWWVIVCSSLSQ